MAGDEYHPSQALATVAHLHRACNRIIKPNPSPADVCTSDKLPVGDGTWSRAEVLRYGDFAMATYEAFDDDKWSPYYGTCRYGLRRMLPAVGVAHHGYQVTAFIYATVDVLPQWMEPVLKADKWDDRAHWLGYVAVAGDDEAHRTGFRDLAVVWRGTGARVEWVLNIRSILVPFHVVDGKKGKEKVARGFYGLYTSRNPASEYGKRSAREQLAGELQRLVHHFRDERGEKVRVTVTGHSLGGAVALLAARDAAATHPDVPVRTVTFCAPRVGNAAFRDSLVGSGVNVLRVVVRNDVVPWLPLVPGATLLALPFSLLLGKALTSLTRGWAPSWVYVHVGVELVLEVASSRHLRPGYDMQGFHNLDVCLHLLDGERDVALVNKFSGMLRQVMRVPERWFQTHNKGLMRDANGRWVMKERDHDDRPAPNDKLQLADLHCHGGTVHRMM